MFLLIIILSYLLGCASTVALILYFYTRYTSNRPVVINEKQDEQFSLFHPLSENERAKNSAVDAVNYLLQFLFQELKDSSRLRRYIMHKLNTEFKELKNSRTGKIFLHNIVIQNFSIGNECPVFSDIQLERQERDERQLIKAFVARLDADYKDGFSVTLDITLLFGHKCLLYIKVKRIQGNLRLELRREPFCHWLLVFQDEPLIDFEVKSSFATVESPQLAQIITQQLRRAIKRKQTWPSYKIRYQPFFATSKQSLPTEILTASGKNVVPGTFEILIKYCDRLSIPLAIFDKQKLASELVFLTINVHKKTCADYLRIKREQWLTKEIEFVRNLTKMSIKEVNYMDRTELLIEDFEPLPNGLEDSQAFKTGLAEKNLFLLKVRGEDVKTSKQTQRLLKSKSNPTIQDASASSSSISTLANEDKISIVIGMPLLHSVRVESIKESEQEKQTSASPVLPTRTDPPVMTSPILRHRTNKQIDDDDEQQQPTETTTKPPENQTNKKPKPQKTSNNDITLIMMNTDLLSQFHDQPTPPQKPDAYIEFNHGFEFQVTPEERYLNVCLWSKAPLECGAPNAGQKLILLGYATIALSEIVLDAHMSYKRETQMTLNFRSPYSSKANLFAYLTDTESKKRIELSTHKGYDDDLAHGFVTINVKHRPEIEAKLNLQEKKEQFLKNGPILNEISTKLREEERKQDQMKYINTINEQQETPLRKPTDHIFEDKTFTTATVCSGCNKKIWMKSGRQCRDCLQTIHKKCEDKFIIDTTCPHEPIQAKLVHISSPSDEDFKNIVNIELNMNSNNTPVITTTDEIEANLLKSNESTPISTTNSNFQRSTAANRLHTKAAAAFSVLDSTARRSFRAFGNKQANSPATTTLPSVSSAASLSPSISAGSELSKSDESLHNSAVTSTKKTAANTPSPSQTSSKLANAASSAYSKLREFKSKRLPTTTTIATPDNQTVRKSRLPSDSTLNETIPESDLRDIITKCLSDENNDFTGLEHLLHERAVDHTTLYAKAREVGPELFPELTPDERKQKLDSEIARLQQEIDLQCQIRDEITHDSEDPNIDENEKAKLKAKIENINDKIQALGALTILYCSGLKHCHTQMDSKSSLQNQIIIENDSQEYVEALSSDEQS